MCSQNLSYKCDLGSLVLVIVNVLVVVYGYLHLEVYYFLRD